MSLKNLRFRCKVSILDRIPLFGLGGWERRVCMGWTGTVIVHGLMDGTVLECSEEIGDTIWEALHGL